MAYTIVYKGHFDSAHYLLNYPGKCKNLHGHRFNYELYIKFIELNHQGIALDFNEIKAMMKAIEDQVDHKCLNEVLPFNPTAENISKWIFDEVSKLLSGGELKRVIIWESDKAGVEYTKD